MFHFFLWKFVALAVYVGSRRLLSVVALRFTGVGVWPHPG